MNDSFGNSWHARWAGLAEQLEHALENNATRFVLCFATIALVVMYIGAVTRLAEPPRWTDSRYVMIQENGSEKFEVRDIDLINRAINRVGKQAAILGLRPQRLVLHPTRQEARRPYAIETHVLRLWLDEIRGFAPEGMFDVTSEAIARAIVAITFQADVVLDELPPANSNWYTHVKTMRETCVEKPRSEWRGLCAVLESTRASHSAEDEIPNPLSLADWVSSQIVAESETLLGGDRIEFLRNLLKTSSDSELQGLGRVDQWPREARDYAPILRKIVSKLAPTRALQINFRASKPLHIVTSCQLPRIADLAKELEDVEAREVVWARVCDSNGKQTSRKSPFLTANSAQEFAEKNPTAVFAQIGVEEMKIAIKKGWVDSQIDIANFLVQAREKDSRAVATQLRSQSEEWNAKAQAHRVKAPIEVLKLVRLRTI